MAYCRFDFDAAASPAGARAEVFTRPEWQVIAMARLAGPASLEKPGRIGRLAERLFGKPAHRPLENRRLESLRRLAVSAWAGDWQRETDQFLAAGYRPMHLAAVLEMIGQAR